MSIDSIQMQPLVDPLTLADLLNPMQFKAVLLAAGGLRSCEIARSLATTEKVIENALADAYRRTGCSTSGEVVCRYFSELLGGVLELGRLYRELAELESRIGQNLRAPIGDLLRHMN
jgi:DNA-binding CsgD family transcriptional regulator